MFYVRSLRHAPQLTRFLYSHYGGVPSFSRVRLTICSSLSGGRGDKLSGTFGRLPRRKQNPRSRALDMFSSTNHVGFYSPTIGPILYVGALRVLWISRSPTEFRFRERTNLNALVEAMNFKNKRNHFFLFVPILFPKLKYDHLFLLKRNILNLQKKIFIFLLTEPFHSLLQFVRRIINKIKN